MKQYIIPSILSFFVTLLCGLILWKIRKGKLSLQYDLIESGIFPREVGEGKYFVIKLKNTGDKAIENISLEINFNTGEIETVRFFDSRLLTSVIQDSSKISAILPLLNPKEDLSITITAKGTPSISTPNIIARAVGVTAIPAKEREFSLRSFILFIALIVSIMAIITTYIVINERLNKLPLNIIDTKNSLIEKLKEDTLKLKEQKIEYEKGKPEREDYIFSVLNKTGLGHVYPQLVSPGSEITYRNTGFFLMHLYLISNEINKEKIIKSMESLLEIKEIAPGSRGILLYLLAKMEQFQGNHVKTLEYLRKCEKEAPLMYKHLMSQDPFYDLQNLKKWLLKNWKY